MVTCISLGRSNSGVSGLIPQRGITFIRVCLCHVEAEEEEQNVCVYEIRKNAECELSVFLRADLSNPFMVFCDLDHS